VFFCVRAIEMIDSLAWNLKTIFSDFWSHATNICIFGKLFYIDVSGATEKQNCSLS
jgi:hypothetical protein